MGLLSNEIIEKIDCEENIPVKKEKTPNGVFLFLAQEEGFVLEF